MNIWGIACFLLSIIFIISSLLFTFLREKGAILVSGFNSIPKSKREEYNKKKISLDMRNSLLTWSIILFLGGISSYFINKYCGVIGIIIWLIVFFKDVHMSPYKAFEKYKK